MEINKNQKTCMETNCSNCNVKLLVQKEDVKEEISQEKGELEKGWDFETVKEFPDTGTYQDLDFKITYVTQNKLNKDVFIKYFDCIVCGARNICYSNRDIINHESFQDEISRKIETYELGCYIPNRSNGTSFPEVILTEDQFKDMLDWKPKKLFKYLKENHKEEDES